MPRLRQHAGAPRGRLRLARLVLCALATAVAARAQTPAAGEAFASCAAQFAQTPDDYEAAYCFYQTALDTGRLDDGRRAVEALAARPSGNHWLTLVLGHFHRTGDAARAEALYRRAADAFRAAGHEEGELVSQSTLRDLLFPRGRVAEADAAVARIVAIGAGTANRTLQARAWTLEALHRQASGGDVGAAYRLLKRGEAAIAEGGAYRARRVHLNALGQAAGRLGRLDEALDAFTRLAALARRERDLQTEAIARYNAFTTQSIRESYLPSASSRIVLHDAAREALDVADAARVDGVRAKLHAALAEFLLADARTAAEADTHVVRCLEIARDAGLAYDDAVCSWIEARLAWPADRTRAARAEARAAAATSRANNPRTDAFSASRHMRHGWRTRPGAEGTRLALDALGALETLRALQDGPSSSADVFAAWTLDYYWLSGVLLARGNDGDVEQAFGVTERMRARSLLDVLERSREALDPSQPAVAAHRQALEAISRAQRMLLEPAASAADRAARLQALEALEREEQDARRRLDLAFPGRVQSARFATVAAVRAALEPHEAFVSFQVGVWNTYDGDDGGGAWLTIITRDGVRVRRLPDRTALAPIVPVFVGLLQHDAVEHGAAAARLYRDLFGDVLGTLPAHVTRLVIAADGVLQQLPFDALRASADAPPLGERYEIVHVPSATLWQQWRAGGRENSNGRTLVFADPAIVGDGPASQVRGGLLESGFRPGRLPHARVEGRAIARHLGSVQSFIDDDASEHTLKTTALDRYAIVHLAAHAVADDARPERSAVLLAPGGPMEDGLLQPREIEQLDLNGRVVVLSACQTASGAALAGEGVLSLARAFFAAGAHAVIGSRWPLRDRDAAQLFDSFYRALAEGQTLASALHTAQRDARRAGLPPSAWAGLVLFGDGSRRPVPARPSRAPDTQTQGVSLATAAAGVVLVAGTLTVLARRRRLEG